MHDNLRNRLLSFRGRIARIPYLLSGTVLVGLKYLIDRSIASHFGLPWYTTAYFLPPRNLSVFALGTPYRAFFLTLWAVAIPFFWAGISLTIRRLRDAGQRLGWVFLFFVPIVNLAFFLYLSVAPSAPIAEHASAVPDADLPQRTRSPLWGIVIAGALGLAFVLLSANFFQQYAWGLFLGVPFTTGFVASWLYNTPVLRTKQATVTFCAMVPVVIGFALIGFRLEGIACLVMALPLALPFSIAGGLVAYRCLEGGVDTLTPPRITACVAILPLVLIAEHAAKIDPPARPVVTSIEIHAPAAVVWKNVIAFSPLAPPTEWVFHTGVAYPIGATIRGSGVGAVRYCRFSTGDFVEPITTWDENRLLAFNVTAQPPSMHEVGRGEISTPHITGNYMRSQHGQFRIVALDSTHTLLEGTTWYQDYFWPQAYWRMLSDAIVHRIHLRVLDHIKHDAEAQAAEIAVAAGRAAEPGR